MESIYLLRHDKDIFFNYKQYRNKVSKVLTLKFI